MRTTQRDIGESVLDRVVAILDAFQPGDAALSVASIVRRTGLAKATAHRLVNEMAAHGLLERPATGGVILGSRLYELGHLVPRQRNLRDTALPLLGDLFEATRAAVNLAILEKDTVIYLAKLTTRNNPQVGTRVGGRMPAYCTAVGKAILAFSPPAVARIVTNGEMPRLTAYTLDTPAKLIRDLARVREDGVAFDREESALGTSCVAAPVLDANGMALAAISVTSWAHRRPDARRHAAAVKTTALTLSRQLSTVSEPWGTG